MILEIFSPKNLAKMFAFFAQTSVSFCKNCDHNIGFWEKRQIFRRKLAKIAENRDHNIDPWNKYLMFYREKNGCCDAYEKREMEWNLDLNYATVSLPGTGLHTLMRCVQRQRCKNLQRNK
jgi:hypothetical protein